MFVIPLHARVRDPRTRQPIPAEGAEVPADRFWLRRIADGSVRRAVKAEPAATRRAAPASDAKPKSPTSKES